jgi:hypothetical protein
MSDYDVAALFRAIESTVKSDRAPAAGFKRLVDYCATVHSHPDWSRIAELDVNEDLARLQQWLSGLLTHDPPGADLDGYWFGLCNPVFEDGTGRELVTADMYVSASCYDDADPDWACETTWCPEGYAGSRVLQGIYGIAYQDTKSGLGNLAEYPLALGYGALAVRWLVQGLPASVVLHEAGRCFVAVGFDSGDFICIGAVGSDGLVFSRDSQRFVP